MSLPRSRRAGSTMSMTWMRKYKSWRNLPCCTSASKSWWLALITRKSTSISVSLPIGRMRFSCTARSSFTCIVSGNSAISSKNKLPPCADRISPCLSWVAPVKLPLRCPNNSLSISSVGMAPQLMAINGPSLRLLRRCTRLATTSLPVPDSPVIKTGACERAIFFKVMRSCWIGRDWPISRRCSSVSSWICSWLMGWLKAFCKSCSKCFWLIGLLTKSNAPAFSAAIAISILP